jgi:hypothetical protein
MINTRTKKFSVAGILVIFATIVSSPAFSHQLDNPSNSDADGYSMDLRQMRDGHSGMMDNMMRDGHMSMMHEMMDGDTMGMMGQHNRIGLSDDQIQKMNDIQHTLRKKHWELMGPMIDQKAALKKAYANERPDPEVVGAIYGQIFDLKRQMIEARLDAKNSLRDILTEDQIQQMSKMNHRQGGMMKDQGADTN